MKDFLKQVDSIKDFGTPLTDDKQLTEALSARQRQFSAEQREILVDVLVKQNPNLNEYEAQSMEKLKSGAFTVTTGHQLMVCGGTAFFEIKILGAIALANRIEKETGTSVVPIFWMATEDHDFEEIASFSINGQKFTWSAAQTGGPVGRIEVDTLAAQLEKFLSTADLNKAQHAMLHSRLASYKKASNLAEATRDIVRKWVGQFGVLVIDGDDASLKQSASLIWEKEMNGELSRNITQTTASLTGRGYKAQVHPREINLFSLEGVKRERILRPMDLAPVDISPNALLRPVYQEFVLPNLVYVGGGGELAYWLQIGGVFKDLDIPMPLLYLRDSVVPLSVKAQKKLEQLGLDVEDVLNKSYADLVAQHVDSKHDIALQEQRINGELQRAIEQWQGRLKIEFPELGVHSEAIAQGMLNKLGRSTKSRMRVLKAREATWTNRLHSVREEVFPDNTFWERHASYADLLNFFEEDPKLQLVEKMSTIKAGTYILFSEK